MAETKISQEKEIFSGSKTLTLGTYGAVSLGLSVDKYEILSIRAGGNEICIPYMLNDIWAVTVRPVTSIGTGASGTKTFYYTYCKR